MLKIYRGVISAIFSLIIIVIFVGISDPALLGINSGWDIENFWLMKLAESIIWIPLMLILASVVGVLVYRSKYQTKYLFLVSILGILAQIFSISRHSK
jgi:hypothetical protein